MPLNPRNLEGQKILTVITEEEAISLRGYIAHDYIPFDTKHEPLHAFVRYLLAELEARGL